MCVRVCVHTEEKGIKEGGVVALEDSDRLAGAFNCRNCRNMRVSSMFAAEHESSPAQSLPCSRRREFILYRSRGRLRHSDRCALEMLLALSSRGYASYRAQSMRRAAHGPDIQPRTSQPPAHPPRQVNPPRGPRASICRYKLGVPADVLQKAEAEVSCGCL